jgi:hypothetical protein
MSAHLEPLEDPASQADTGLDRTDAPNRLTTVSELRPLSR